MKEKKLNKRVQSSRIRAEKGTSLLEALNGLPHDFKDCFGKGGVEYKWYLNHR